MADLKKLFLNCKFSYEGDKYDEDSHGQFMAVVDHLASLYKEGKKDDAHGLADD